MSNLFGLNQIENFRSSLDERSQNSLSQAINKITEVKRNGGKIMVVTGSGPNIHEGVTTLIAELIRVGIVDAVSTSSAVIAHEMAGSLDKVFRVDAKALGMDMSKMPRGDVFEFTSMSDEEIEKLKLEMPLDEDLLKRGKNLPKLNEIIKAAGNMAYPMGFRTEKLALEVLSLARMYGLPFETVAGWGCDEKTMLGAAAKKNIPVLAMGPICITPELKRKGYGKILLDYSLEKAKEMNFGAVLFEGNIAFYGKSGFDYASKFGIRYHDLPEGADASFFLCKELIAGYLDGITGVYLTPQGYYVDDADVEEFDKLFPHKEKLKLPGQIF